MNTNRYRIGIDDTKIKNWTPEWWSDYEHEPEAVQCLVEQIRFDLEKWQISEVKHGSGLTPGDRLVSPEKRQQIIRAALAHLASAPKI